MTNDEYAAVHAINYSALRLGRTSLPRMHALITGTLDRIETDALTLGSMLHQAMDEGDGWSDRYALRPEGIDRRTKAGKEAYAAWVANLRPDAVVMESASQVDAVVTAGRMRQSILSHPLGRGLATAAGPSEVMIVRGERKCRIDKVVCTPDGKPVLLVDWKTTIDASPMAFARSAAKYGYHQQAAWYTDLAHGHYGVKLPFIFVAVENTAPYSVGIYQLAADQLDAARNINESIVTAYRRWLENADVHHTGNDFATLELPEWACKDHLASADFASVGDADDTPF